MKRFLLIAMLMLIAGQAYAAATAISFYELSSSAFLDSTTSMVGATASPWSTISSTDGVTFTNDGRTFVELWCYSGTPTATITAPSATVKLKGLGTVSISNITITFSSTEGNKAIIKVPTFYNVGGRVTLTVSDANKLKIRIVRLSDY